LNIAGLAAATRTTNTREREHDFRSERNTRTRDQAKFQNGLSELETAAGTQTHDQVLDRDKIRATLGRRSQATI
jgi:hypothetical protein